MEEAIKTVATVFVKSCKGKDGLTESNFQNLVKNQLSNIMTDTDSKTAVSNLRQGLDADQDKKVSFEEYMKLIGYLATALSEQRAKGNDETVQKADTEPQHTLSSQPENNQQGKEDGKEEPTKVEKNAEAKPDPAKEEEKPAAAAATLSVELPDKPAVVTEMVTSVVITNESIKVEESETAEIAKEKLATAVEEEGEGEEKTDEATS